MMRARILGATVLMCGALAFAGDASAFGGGHFGGGGMGGMHMGGGGMGGGMHMGGGLGGMHAGAFASPGLQTGRSVAVGGANISHAPATGGGLGNGGHHGWRHGGGFGYGYGGYGLGFGGDYYGDDAYGYGYPGDYGYDYGYNDPAYGYDQGVQTGRSAAEGGDSCRTPVKTCTLFHPSAIGQPCSCRISGGRSQGRVSP